jgi:hypothetical protein
MQHYVESALYTKSIFDFRLLSTGVIRKEGRSL